jgi:hypothetical protein
MSADYYLTEIARPLPDNNPHHAECAAAAEAAVEPLATMADYDQRNMVWLLQRVRYHLTEAIADRNDGLRAEGRLQLISEWLEKAEKLVAGQTLGEAVK